MALDRCGAEMLWSLGDAFGFLNAAKLLTAQPLLGMEYIALRLVQALRGSYAAMRRAICFLLLPLLLVCL